MAAETMRAELRDHIDAAGSMDGLIEPLAALADEMCRRLSSGGRLYTFGNGGSAAQAQHFATELIGRYRRERRPLPAVALTADSSALTCIGNDYSYDDVFSRQVQALATSGDVVAGLTTSGRSPNVVRGLAAAREAGALTVLFAAGDGADARQHADHALLAPTTATARTQEMHLLMLHLLSEAVDQWVEASAPEAAARADRDR